MKDVCYEEITSFSCVKFWPSYQCGHRKSRWTVIRQNETPQQAYERALAEEDDRCVDCKNYGGVLRMAQQH